jgi:outer membrane usher protein FimD/PapC
MRLACLVPASALATLARYRLTLLLPTASSMMRKSPQPGQSYRVQYSKTVATTATTVTLASYRYSTEGFYTFQEVNEFSSQRYNKRSRLQLNLSQSLQSWGNFYISAYQQDYWSRQAMSATSAPALTPVSRHQLLARLHLQ